VGRQVAAGDLEGVEDEAGAAIVDGLVGETDDDFTERFLDGGAVEESRELEFVDGDDGG